MSSRDGGLNIYVASEQRAPCRPLLKPVSTCIHRSCYSNPVFSPDEKHIAALYSGSYSIAARRPARRRQGHRARPSPPAATEEEGYGTHIGPPSWGPAPR